jgi:glycosyltransferase involved in cell wall biosynthesis
MKIAMLSPIAWRTPPRHYGPWESIVSLLTEGLIERGFDVTLFATADSLTRGRLQAVCPAPYEEDRELDAKVWECLHIAHLFEQASKFDIIHNNFDFLPLSYSQLVDTPMVTTIHGFSSAKILPVYKHYNQNTNYIAISNADRHPDLTYRATIYHGVDLRQFTFQSEPSDYLLFFGRIHPDKGAAEAVEIAKQSGRKLIIAGIIQDQDYYNRYIAPSLKDGQVEYVGSVEPPRRNKLLGEAYALLHPIHFDEPFGLSVIEAQACGTPVICFNKGSMPEVVLDDKTGFLIGSVAEAIKAVEKVEQLKRSACRQWVEENFTQSIMIDKYIDIYREIAKDRDK